MARIPPPSDDAPLPGLPTGLVSAGAGLDALDLLRETEGDAGVLLWRAARAATLWALTPPPARAGLFAHGAAARQRAELARLLPSGAASAPLAALADLLERPGSADPAEVAAAAAAVAAWAEERGALATALAFAQAAALALPECAATAYSTGHLARRRAEYPRAERWLAHAVELARATGDRETQARALSGLGNVHAQAGAFGEARRAHVRALRAARRYGLREVEGDAWLDLYAVEVETGAGPEADRLALRAFRAYGPGHPKLPRLGYDVAYHWVQRGLFAPALAVAESVVSAFPGVAERLLSLGLVARAAGGAGDRRAYERAAEAVWEALAEPGADERAAGALLGLAHGASSLGRWHEALEAGELALEAALRRRHGKIVLEAEATIEFVRIGQRTQVAPVPAAPEPTRRLAEALVGALAAAP